MTGSGGWQPLFVEEQTRTFSVEFHQFHVGSHHIIHNLHTTNVHVFLYAWNQHALRWDTRHPRHLLTLNAVELINLPPGRYHIRVVACLGP